MTDYKKIVNTTKDDVMVKLEGLTGAECYNSYGFCADETITHTVKFPNDKEVDIKMVIPLEENETVWYEGVLFNKNGAELNHTECEETFMGEWFLSDDEDTYTIIIKEPLSNTISEEDLKDYQIETRVAIVEDDLTGPVNYQTCSDETFYEKAEEQGNVFSLKGFEEYIYTGQLQNQMEQVHHPNYLIPRFIPVYEIDGRIMLDDRPLKENRYAEYHLP